MDIKIKKLTPKLIDEFFDFFDNVAFSDHEEWGGCYCMFYHLTSQMHAENEKRGTMDNREYARQYIKEGKLQGYFAYKDNNIVGWCNANDKDAYIEYNKDNSPELWEDVPSGKTKLITCFVIEPNMRRKGIATKLVEYIVKDAKKEKYKYLEAYPLFGEQSVFAHYHGPIGLYEKLGFEVVDELERMYIIRKKL